MLVNVNRPINTPTIDQDHRGGYLNTEERRRRIGTAAALSLLVVAALTISMIWAF